MRFEITTSVKLIRVGKYSLNIVLPAWWLKAHRLKAGDVVKLIVSPDSITITPEGAGGSK